MKKGGVITSAPGRRRRIRRETRAGGARRRPAVDVTKTFFFVTDGGEKQGTLTKGRGLVTLASSLQQPRNTKGGSITVPLTSCLTGLEPAV